MKLGQAEYRQRRAQLMAQMEANSIAIVPTAVETVRNRDVEHPFRQDSDFYYLSGFAEANACLVLIPGREEGEYILFCEDKDPDMEIWTGRRAGPEGAAKDFFVDEAYPIEAIDSVLPTLIEGKARIYTEMGANSQFDTQLTHWVNQVKAMVRKGAQVPHEYSALDHLLHEMRLIKSSAEIEMMQKAADISAAAHCRAMKTAKPGCFEYQLEAELLHEFTREGSRWPAYPSIVGGGENACILHYTNNDMPIADGGLILIDAGCELDYYAADITRTFPVNGKFSPEQKALYELVLKAQLAAIEQVKPGNSWNAAHEVAVEVLVTGLLELGLLTGDIEQLIEDESYKVFYMHRTGHWLGMDVHDVGEYRINKEWRPLKEGMVLTIEPGLYIAPDCKDVDPRWRGIGIRIEDDVVVTADGHHILSHKVPKTVAEIEALMAS
jgi:Xaa-Pro aminopeptidase|tara:strand:- start:19399 stop:20712 length:1314 start_codon:yes stop_codon:yes gene_type:complete